ncbi:hypothetical protein [Kribbella capetownensis]|uniref:hypothetical protein n=1 Tax=Kribbella capetownensis TaxID=1572659 RepID=UPI0013F3C821|nr:hypothetical protein [Kribbella capetownensis]
MIDERPLHQYGSPMWRVSGDRQMTSPPDERRVENYHHPRFLMLSLQSVRRMLAAGS